MARGGGWRALPPLLAKVWSGRAACIPDTHRSWSNDRRSTMQWLRLGRGPGWAFGDYSVPAFHMYDARARTHTHARTHKHQGLGSARVGRVKIQAVCVCVCVRACVCVCVHARPRRDPWLPIGTPPGRVRLDQHADSLTDM